MKISSLHVLAISAVFFGFVSANACIIPPPPPPPCPSCPTNCVSIDFDDFYAGTLLGYTSDGGTSFQRYESATNSNIADGMGFTIEIHNNSGGAEVASLYDTDKRLFQTNDGATHYGDTEYTDVIGVVANSEGQYYGGTRDSDLEYRWNGGNVAYEHLGNALIIQEDVYTDHSAFTPDYLEDGHLRYVQGDYDRYQGKVPDDEAAGGYIQFGFETAMDSFGFTFADLDAGEDASITFFDTSGQSIEVGFEEFSSGLFQNRSQNTSGSVVWENNYANRIDAISVAELNQVMGSNLNNFSQVKFGLSNSGGITHINYCYSPVPEPSTYLAGSALLFMIGFHFSRSRKKRK